MRTVSTCLLAASLFACAAPAQDPAAAGAPPRPDRGPERRFAPMERIMAGGDIEQNILLRALDNPQIAERLQITDAQRDAIATSFQELDAQLETLRPRLEDALKVQTGLLGEPDLDQDKLMAAVEDAWKLRTEIAKIQTRKLLALRSHLTADQITRSRDLIKDRMEMLRQRRGAGVRNRGVEGEGPARGGPRGERRAPRGGAGRGERPRQGRGAPFTPALEP